MLEGDLMAAKDTASYWKEKVVLRTSNYYARMSHRNRQVWVKLDTGNINSAAQMAARKFRLLKAEGWDALMPTKKSGDTITVGEYVSEVEGLKIVRQSTLSGYIKKLRQLAAEVKGISDRNRQSIKAHDWIAKVDKVQLSYLTPERIKRWRKRKIDERIACLYDLDDEDAHNRAHNTVNAILRNAKGLFSKKILERVDVNFSTLPLSGVSIGAPSIKPFQPEVDFDCLIDTAKNELDEDLHLIFLLAAGCGLRRSEIDRIRRQDIDLSSCKLKVVSTADGSVKTNNSIRTLNFSKGGAVFTAIKTYRLGFHLVCPENDRPKRKAEKYRCDEQFRELSHWLRSKGIKNAIQPIHYLRKAFGDRVASQHGIDIAAISLGDSIEIAHKVYNSHNKTKAIL